MLNAKKIGVIVVTVAVAGTIMFFGIQAVKNSQVQNTQNNTSISQVVKDPVNMGTSETPSSDNEENETTITEEEKNIDEAVTTIDEVETDDQGQLAANAGGSGEAEVYETGEDDVVVGKDPSLVENTENSEAPASSGTVNFNIEGGSWNNEAYTDTDSFELPSEEDNAWFDSKVDEYGTVLH